MTYGIIGAMDEEIAHLLNYLTNKKEYKVANSLFYTGTIRETDVVLLKSGIGKVNAAMATTILMEKFQPNYVINTGSAGGFSPTLQVGDIVISEEVVHHDVDATAFNYAYGQVPQMPHTYKANSYLLEKTKEVVQTIGLHYEVGLVATGDSFMADEKRIAAVKTLFPQMLAAEMEGAAIGQVCYQYDVPFIIIRSISDVAGRDSSVSFEQFLQKAARHAAKIVLTLIE